MPSCLMAITLRSHALRCLDKTINTAVITLVDEEMICEHY